MGFFKKIKNKVTGNKQSDVVLDKIEQVKSEKADKYSQAMSKSRESFTKKIKKLTTKHVVIDEAYFDELEETLISSDLGATYVMKLVDELKTEARINKATTPEQMHEVIFEKMFSDYLNNDQNITKINLKDGELNVILVIGVNGVGKTTTIGKLTKKFQNEGKKVALAAADTFRAGAVEQLKVWAERSNAPITTPEKEGQDPASVVYQAIEKAKTDGTDILICDTAGRLQNKVNLMKELEKINKIIVNGTGEEPKETLLVIDATTGQSGVQQAEGFNEVTKITGIVLTKMDSSSKGGIIIAIKSLFDIPVKYIGLGEQLDDLEEFDVERYIYGLISEEGEVNEED